MMIKALLRILGGLGVQYLLLPLFLCCMFRFRAPKFRIPAPDTIATITQTNAQSDEDMTSCGKKSDDTTTRC